MRKNLLSHVFVVTYIVVVAALLFLLFASPINGEEKSKTPPCDLYMLMLSSSCESIIKGTPETKVIEGITVLSCVSDKTLLSFIFIDMKTKDVPDIFDSIYKNYSFKGVCKVDDSDYMIISAEKKDKV